MRTIYLIRHGSLHIPSDKKLCIGQTNFSLSSKGVEEVNNIKRELKDKNIEFIFHSPLTRCVQSAMILSQEIITCVEVEKFKEIGMGIWEEMTFEDIKNMYPSEYKQRGENIGSYVVPNGESFEMCLERSRKAFVEIASQTNGNIIIVSHAGINRTLISWLNGRHLDELSLIPQPYGCINIINERMGDFYVEKIGVVPRSEEL